MDSEKVKVDFQCTFCFKSKNDGELIDMNSSSILLDGEMLEFYDLIRSLFRIKLQQEQSALTCEDCKNILIQFHVFKNNVRRSSLSMDDLNDNLTKVTMFLDENENEEIYCMRYNKCLTLVPDSKRTFMEIFKHWQPHVVLDKLDELPPPRKRTKLQESTENLSSKEEMLEIEVVENDCNEELETVEENLQDGMTENEWLEMELGNSEIVETEEGDVESWLCTHCEPFERFLDPTDFRNHLTSMHLDFEQVIYEEDETVEDFEENKSEIVNPPDNEIALQPKMKTQLVVPDYYNCSSCSFTSGSRGEFKMHQKTHVDLRQFQTTKFERLFCVDCSYQFTTAAHYQAHVNGHQLYDIVAKYSSYPICDLCNMMFCEDSFANFHQEKHELGALIEDAIPAEGMFLKFGHHRPSENENDSLMSMSDDALKCGHCLKKFADEESCRLHQLIFHITILKCPIEKRVFNGNQAFSIHLKNNHPELFGDVKFLCSVCKMEFDTLYEKLKHMKTCDKKKFQCSHCEKKFSQKCYLMTHLRQVSGQTSVVCEVCQKVCRDKGDYQIHFRSHSNVKPFKCSICTKAYKTSSARAAHLETHLEKGFDCDFCTTKFKSRRTLQKHVKTKHSKTPQGIYISNLCSKKVIAEELVETF